MWRKLNDEATLNVIDADFARQQTRIFNDDLAKSQVIGLVDWPIGRANPLAMRAMLLPEPHEWVHPSVPCPVFR